ncbi:hypothetical protein [Saccharopolyspora elongata]|nr:hypothetical protein [Saccharopolyspora elongata]
MLYRPPRTAARQAAAFLSRRGGSSITPLAITQQPKKDQRPHEQR